jgi:hypothetical protein
MYKVYFYNFGYYSSDEGKTLDEAKAIAKKACFQSNIYDRNNELVMSYCTINGFSRYYPICNSNNPVDYLRKVE